MVFQGETMAIPSKAVGYGNNSTARNVFGLSFSTALSSAPKFETYDGGTYPGVGAGTTVAGKSLAGTAGNGNKPMPSLVDTSAAAPASAWMPAAATGGSANPNRVKGQTNFVTSGATLAGASGVRAFGTGFSKTAGALGNGTGVVDSATNPAGVVTWNEAYEMPSDVIPADNLTYDMLVRYTYTGAAPTVLWYFNDNGAGGTEGTPVWTNLVPGTNGLRHCNAGTVAGTYLLDIPASGVVVAAEGWVTA
jgi:hypothetical protein